MLTGFAVNVPFLDRKQACNYPIQGAAFHLTLWSLVQLIRRLRRYHMRSLVIGEIHDCINLDVEPSELDDVIGMATEIMTQEIRQFAPWLNVPLLIEPETCPIDGSWFNKMQLIPSDAGWVPADRAKWEKNWGPW